ncbi:MAG: 2-amino-4-hydroxy-6-hydroxymethyldihydropteridine diphosphokinase [Methylotenera sp.]
MIHSEQLTLPHPRMHTRGFVLLPLFEIAPQLSMPIHGKIAGLINANLSKDIQKLS